MRFGTGAAALLLLTGATPITELEVTLSHLRSSKGMIRLCVTANPKSFPGCAKDAHAVTRSVPASEQVIRVQGLVPGTYAVSVIHDENGNGKLDTFAGIPREGFGFSNNPGLGFGPPRFAAAQFSLAGDADRQQVKIRYLF
ncbi:DUF2141 domain-containing protein [Sphingomonas desiccabilis]|uniref:DUF2141 domain-containing protein n=1 Tax=Sphingomonas desiccabilis TaxID=429134 RepID=A0A4Q2IMT9_9SPHN|nr:DUF2141 domain-containing protein [Sphingomonas desiccabilis]RXZ30650.1 DUF2141 domain-containing protein [Sphingomonas desiccabilis]